MNFRLRSIEKLIKACGIISLNNLFTFSYWGFLGNKCCRIEMGFAHIQSNKMALIGGQYSAFHSDQKINSVYDFQ